MGINGSDGAVLSRDPRDSVPWRSSGFGGDVCDAALEDSQTLSSPVIDGTGYQFMPESWHDRMQTIENYQQDQSAMGRINAWRFAFNLAKDRPLVGGGNQAFTPDLFKRYAPQPENWHDSHSIYFEILGEHGFVGMALFLLLGWFTWRTCSLVAKQARPHPDGQWMADLASMLQVSLVAYATSGAFLGLAYFDLYYHLIALVVLIKVQSNALAGQADLATVSEKNQNRNFQRQRAMAGRLVGK